MVIGRKKQSPPLQGDSAQISIYPPPHGHQPRNHEKISVFLRIPTLALPKSGEVEGIHPPLSPLPRTPLQRTVYAREVLLSSLYQTFSWMRGFFCRNPAVFGASAGSQQQAASLFGAGSRCHDPRSVRYQSSALSHEISHQSSVSRICTNSSRPARSSSVKRPTRGLSMSRTPTIRSPAWMGTTISELDAPSQAMWPGNWWTS